LPDVGFAELLLDKRSSSIIVLGQRVLRGT
jgi:hypothetical protein